MLTRATFAPHVGSTFAVTTGAGDVQLTLAFVSELRVTRSTEAFSLEFDGPLDAPLAADEHRFAHPTIGAFALFVSPVGPGRYEAVFNNLVDGG